MASQETKPIRIFLVDDHQSIRDGYRMLLSVHPDFLVVGEASRSDEAIERASMEQPDVILLDLDLGYGSPEGGLDIIPKLLAAKKGVRILILTGVTDTDKHQEAARRGAMGLVNKEESFQLITKAIRKVHAGEAWFDRSLLGNLLTEKSAGQKEEAPEAAKIASLTERERQIIPLVGRGLSNKQIAEELHMGEMTVRNYLTEIFDKLDVASRFELIIYAYRHGLAKPPGAENY